MNLSELGSVVVIGAGKMGMALVRGWVAAGLDARRLTLVDPKPAEAVTAFAAETGAQLVAAVPDAPADVLVLAIKPQVIGSVYASARGAIGGGTLVVSIVAGISLEGLAEGLGTARIARTMPNTPAQVGKGVTGVVMGSETGADDRAVVEAMLSSVGGVVWLEDESQIDALTAVSGSGPAYVFYFVEALAAAGEKQGLSAEQAMALARRMVIGAAALLDGDPAPASVLRENVTSPNGVTAEALKVLMAADALQPLMDRAVEAARKRSEELGQ